MYWLLKTERWVRPLAVQLWCHSTLYWPVVRCVCWTECNLMWPGGRSFWSTLPVVGCVVVDDCSAFRPASRPPAKPKKAKRLLFWATWWLAACTRHLVEKGFPEKRATLLWLSFVSVIAAWFLFSWHSLDTVKHTWQTPAAELLLPAPELADLQENLTFKFNVVGGKRAS